MKYLMALANKLRFRTEASFRGGGYWGGAGQLRATNASQGPFPCADYRFVSFPKKFKNQETIKYIL